MLTIDIPGYKQLTLSNLVLDYNGTIAFDGDLILPVRERLEQLKDIFTIYVITADTFGSVGSQVGKLAKIKVLDSADHRLEKGDFVRELGADTVVAVGNGRNDADMLKTAELGIVVSQGEGAAVDAVVSADILVNSILNGLDLLLNTKRLIATMRI